LRPGQPAEEILWVLARNDERLAQDRGKNHLQKYTTVAEEVIDAEVTGVAPDWCRIRRLCLPRLSD
jgi:hypothetical protein